MDENESNQLAALAGNKQFASGPVQGCAALLQVAAQGDPGFAAAH